MLIENEILLQQETISYCHELLNNKFNVLNGIFFFPSEIIAAVFENKQK